MSDRGSFNHCIAVVGQPQTGKSTYATARAIQLAREQHGYVVAHDAEQRLPHNLPGIGPSGLRHYRSTAELDAGLRARPGGVHALAHPDGRALIAYARKLSATIQGAQKGHKAPVVLLLDEALKNQAMNRYKLDKDFGELITGRRWENIAIVWTSQQPQMAHYSTMGLGTEVVIFRLTDEASLSVLRANSIPKHWLALVPRLPNYHYLTHKVA